MKIHRDTLIKEQEIKMAGKDFDQERKKVRELSYGMVLYRVINAGGCAWSTIEDSDGCELYSCERKQEKSMIKNAIYLAEGQAQKTLSEDQKQV